MVSNLVSKSTYPVWIKADAIKDLNGNSKQLTYYLIRRITEGDGGLGSCGRMGEESGRED